MTGVLGVKERGQINPEFDNLADSRWICRAGLGIGDVTSKNFSGGCGSPRDLEQSASAQECQRTSTARKEWVGLLQKLVIFFQNNLRESTNSGCL